MYAAIGRHPNSATGFDDADFAELRGAGGPREVRGDRRDRASTTTATTRRARISGARSRPRSSSPARPASRWSSTPAPPTTTRSRCSTRMPRGLRVILHCFSMADRVEECLAHDGLVAVVRRQRHLSQARRTCARRRSGSRPSGCWSRPTPRTCRPSRCAASPTSPPTSSPPRRRSRSSGASPTPSWSGRSSQRGGRVRMVSARSARQRELGQNFLVDRNILDVIERLAELSAGRRGAGDRRRAPACCPSGWRRGPRIVHVVEVDERLEAGLRGALAPSTTSSLHFADALELDLARAGPAARPRSWPTSLTGSPRP